MCTLDASAVDVQELCTRVEDLCQWRWPNPPLAARFFWTAGWLNELVDRSKSALDFYDAFLLMPSREQSPAAAGPEQPGGAADSPGPARWRGGPGTGGDRRFRIANCGLRIERDARAAANTAIRWFPAACFNLLNLINVSLGAADLLRAVDEELMAFFSRLPADVRARGWGGRGVVVGAESVQEQRPRT